jgi:DNA-binding response OmpR family regulator
VRARILIVEDEREVADLIATYLMREGFETMVCHDAESALEAEAAERFDLVVLDINLPGMDGFEFLSDLRTRRKVPVIILSARSTDEDMVLGLGVGADDYMTKPFSFKVLVARVRAHLRRTRDNAAGPSAAREMYCFGDYRLDAEGPFLDGSRGRVDLAPREIATLLFLVRNAGRSFSVKELYESVWGNRYGSVTTVAVHIQRIRRKIEEDPSSPVYIETVAGYGYRFNPAALTGGKQGA